MKQDTVTAVKDPEITIFFNNKEYMLNDVGGAALLADMFKDRMRFCAARNKWLWYNGKIWEDDYQAVKAKKNAIELAGRLKQDAASIDGSEKKNAIMEYARMWQACYYRDMMLKEARGIHTVEVEGLDTDPFLLNCQNGAFDIRTGCFRPASPGDMATKISGAAYDKAAVCQLFERFVFDIAGHDKGFFLFLMRVMAYALTGDTRYGCVFVLEDTEDSRSSDILVDVLLALMGSYGCRLNLTPKTGEKLLDGGGSGKEISQLAGTRFVNVFRCDKKIDLSPALVKRFISGESLWARENGGGDYPFRMKGKVFVSGGVTADTPRDVFSSGKVLVIPLARYSGDYGALREGLLQQGQLNGILNFCLRGLASLWIDGLNPPEAVVKATERYASEKQ